jgi:hypothetical protein
MESCFNFRFPAGKRQQTRMKKLGLLLIMPLLVLVLGLGAAMPVSAASQSGLATTPSLKYPSPNEISIDESDAGKTITIVLGDTLKVNLQYYLIPADWSIIQLDTSILQNTDRYNIIPPPPIVGGGTTVWVFETIGTGTSPMLLEYRYNSGGSLIRTFSVTINVITAPPVPASSNTAMLVLIAGLAIIITWSLWEKQRSQI